MADYIPSTDARLAEWLPLFVNYCTANQATLGLKTSQTDKLAAVSAAWRTAYAEQQAAQTAARAKTRNKVDKYAQLITTLRQTAGIIQANPDVTDEQRRAAGLPVARNTHSSSTGTESANAGINAPLLLSADFSQRGRCTIHFGPNPTNEQQNAKPHGVRGVKIWYAAGGLPEKETGWQWLADDTSSPYIHTPGNSQPVTIAYRAQYFNSRMALGPFSDPVTVTISA